MPAPDLVLFTVGFPYDGSESVLLAEIEVIAPRFGRLFIVPSRRGHKMLPLPPNTTVVDLGWDQGWSRSTKRRILGSQMARRVLTRTLVEPTNWHCYVRGARTYLDILATNLLKAETLRRWLTKEQLQGAVFYDYWFENTTLAIAALRKVGAIRCAVSRAHRFDVFDSAWEDLGRVPFREFKARNMDAVYAVSEDGATYLRRHLGTDASKVALSRLGVPLPDSYPCDRSDPPLVVSCSALLRRKRVDLIPSVLSACNRPLRWIHFGDGPERTRVHAAASSLPSTVSWELKGWVDNAVIRKFYGTHPVAGFLSLSVSEGIPVAMMEAQSFGIPIVALGVGGVAELVTPRTGLILDAAASATDVADALAGVVAGRRSTPDEIRAAFVERYDARTNYEAFADSLLTVWTRSNGAS
jgi:glycosyltransferase involved in cell wall biosynthesis